MDGRRATGRWFPRRYCALVTYPARMNDAANTGAPIRVGSTTGISRPGFILWRLGNGQARIRGDLPQADLVHISELITVVAGLRCDHLRGSASSPGPPPAAADPRNPV